ncbi:MAG: site-specific DNA-methyltransferase [Mesorhizobium sp.]|uniref:DNA-methyltransferase n=1 Tax=Mesorhizobium sp. M7A.F.Ca.ET.027.02.1.1 TaxID=2496655 RepID=UPI000FD3A1BD|nr:DNA methyltransferase [Mesorhizobium sp. M7A.F.Ca.ET.027.02.1.1]RVD15746.1 site-specific DNA-methyltransferase [Mesorhizobium sp. M7A.F.Ca.ET.027.02.1.1]RWD12875.1 MAG: site-specific DNA-methyltransferase [Mesorhizobium sp.]
MTFAPGTIRDSIVTYLSTLAGDASTGEIAEAVCKHVGEVPPSSIRSYLNLNTPTVFERTKRGRYRLQNGSFAPVASERRQAHYSGSCQLFQADCFAWLTEQPTHSVHAVVTDPPYGLLEYTEKETAKLRAGKGGVWRIPPSFDGHQRAPLPRFTVLTDDDRLQLHGFFNRLAHLLARVVVPGGNVLVASNPLLAHIVAAAMVAGGLELRGHVVRQVMTMRGGDRPKNAHQEFEGVSVMPRSQWEPWVMLRAPLDGRVQDNLRKWGTGGFRRPSAERPFGDLIRSSPTPQAERRIAPHPSLKPQHFMRQVVRAALPLGKGIVLDPFMGAGSTMAACNAVGYQGIGVELDKQFFTLATAAVPELAKLRVKDDA